MTSESQERHRALNRVRREASRPVPDRATAGEVNQTKRESERTEVADREAQEDGTQRQPPT